MCLTEFLFNSRFNEYAVVEFYKAAYFPIFQLLENVIWATGQETSDCTEFRGAALNSGEPYVFRPIFQDLH